MSQLKLYFEAQNKKIGLEASATDFIPLKIYEALAFEWWQSYGKIYQKYKV